MFARPLRPVGCADIQLRLADGRPVLARIFYATASGSSSTPWLPHSAYLPASLRWLQSDLDSGKLRSPRSLSSRLRLAVTLAVARLAAPLARFLGLSIPAAPYAQPEPAPPLVVLVSHGLGGHRNVHAAHVLALVQRGFTVVACEHGDGTAVLTPRHSGWLYYMGCGPPGKRHPRIPIRMAELSALADVLQALHAGEQQLPHSARLLRGDNALLLNLFQPKGELRITAMGHSFGGATVLALARTDARIRSAVAHDPWLPALAGAPPSVAVTADWSRSCAVMITICDTWLKNGNHDPVHLEACNRYVRAAGGAAVVLGLADPSNHQTVTDVPLLAPSGRRNAKVLDMHRRIFDAAAAFLLEELGRGLAKREEELQQTAVRILGDLHVPVDKAVR